MVPFYVSENFRCRSTLTHQRQFAGKQDGFTLLELLVVVVIIAILFTYTTLAIRGDTPEDVIKKEATRLELRVRLALEEAILRGEEHAIEINQNGYVFLRFMNSQWIPIVGDKILQQRELPLDMELEMSLEETEIVIQPGSGNKSQSDKTAKNEPATDINETTESDDEDEADSYKPQIFLLSSGEITPEFEIRFYILGVEESYIVKGLFDGTVTSAKSEL